MNSSMRTPGTRSTKVPTKKTPAPTSRSTMNTQIIEVQSTAHANNIQSNSFQASLPTFEGPGTSSSKRSAWPRTSKTLCQFEVRLCRLTSLGYPMGQDGLGRGPALWRVHGVLVPLREKGSHLAVVGCPLLFWSKFDLIGVVLVRQIDPLTIYYTAPDILGTACARLHWAALSSRIEIFSSLTPRPWVEEDSAPGSY